MKSNIKQPNAVIDKLAGYRAVALNEKTKTAAANVNAEKKESFKDAKQLPPFYDELHFANYE